MGTIYTVAGKRVSIHDREEWQSASEPITGPKPNQSLVHDFVIHWPGASGSWNPPLDTAAHLRQSQHSYLTDPNRGYSYGYGFVIGYNKINWSADPVIFDCWEVRGFDIQIASNDGDKGKYGDYSNPNFNGRSCSVQLMCSTNYKASTDQIDQARYLMAIGDLIYQETLTVIPHRTSDDTSCPGDYLTSMIASIAVRPGKTEPPKPQPPAGDFMATLPTIKKGSTGEYVERMQHLLAAAGYMNPANVANYDGVWGNGTDDAKKRFDLDHHLTPSPPTDCGPKSWESLMTGKVW